MLGNNNNASDNFRPYKDEESIPKVQDIEGNHKNSISKSSDIRSCIRVGHTS